MLGQTMLKRALQHGHEQLENLLASNKQGSHAHSGPTQYVLGNAT